MSPSSRGGRRHAFRPIATITTLALASLGAAVPAFAAPQDDPSSASAGLSSGDESAATFAQTDGSIFISEIHYDNAGTDAREFIEIQAPAGTSLNRWTVVLYGADGVAYNTSNVRGSASNGTVVVNYGSESIVNGTGGVALVNPDGGVVEFLSYGGAITAADGPAAGLASTDLAVQQTETERGLTLQRIGTTWTGPVAGTQGALNPEPEPEPEVEAFISEIHYDNAGADTGEAIEVQATVGADLTGWTLVLYNGNGGSSYDTDPVGGVVPDAGVLVVNYPTDGVQNGSPDGVALVDADGNLVEFLTYEGTFTANNGPAAGVTGTDIGVSEASSTPIGQSLQLIDGVWTGPATSSFGTINTAEDPGEPGEPGEDTHTIAQIQGTGDASPVAGQTVTTTGVVTAAYPTGGFNGYYLQTAGSGGDADPSTRTASDAVFVFSGATVGSVQIGDHVQVTGTVVEFNGLTEITVGAGGAVVLDTPAEAVKPIEAFALPGSDAEREVFEGMLVAPVADYVVSDTYALGGWGTTAFGSIGLGLGGPLVQETDVALPGTPEFDAVAADNAARAITLDDGQSARTATSANVPYLTGAPNVRTGAGLTFASPVIVDYRFQWNFQPTAPVDGNADDVVLFNTGNTQEANATPADVGGDLTLATFNVLNYFTTLGVDLAGCQPYTDRDGNPITVDTGCDARGAWDAENLQRQQDKIVAAINGLGADVVSLEEIENSAQFGQDRDAALAALVDALNADAGAGTWAFAPSPAVLPDLAEQDVIRNAFIYRPASVELAGESVVLTGSAAFDNAREPLAQAFTAVGSDYTFVAVTNHFKSKGGDCGDLPEGCFDADRVAQAQALTAFAQEVADAAEVEDIFLLGDFNSYGAENPVVALEDAGYTNLNTDETTYVFDGKVGSLDHVFANASALEQVTGVDVWSINSAESVLAEYSRYNYFASEHFQAGTQFRASDHDPIIVGIDVPETATPTVDINLLSINDFHGRIEANGQSAGGAVLSCAVDSFRTQNPNTLFVSAGDSIGASTFTSFIQQDQPTIDVLNTIGLDVSAFGNHEFDQGQDDVNDRVIPASNWPYVAANIVDANGDPVYDPYTILDVDGISVGFIGAITEEMPALVSPAGIEGLTFSDMGEAVNSYSAQLSDGDEANGEADVIVVLVHDGAPSPDLASADGTPYGDLVAGADSNIDAILSGHTHTAYTHDVDGMWVTQTGQYGEAMGNLALTVDRATGEVTAATAENVDLVPVPGDPRATPPIPRETFCEGDPAVQEIIDEAVAVADELGAVPLGEITADFNRARQSDGSENRGGESTLGNFVADVQLWAAQRTNPNAQIALMNPGGLRADMTYAASGNEGDGVLTYREAAIVQPFANTLVTTVLTGDQLAQVLEEQWQPDTASRPFLRLGVSAGLTYTYDPDAAAGERILDLSLNGEPIDAAGQYTVVVNSFLASGGDNFATLAEGTNTADSGQSDLVAMVDYMAEFGSASPDYSQRAVGVNWVSDPAAEYAAGDEIALDLSSLAFSAGEPVPAEVVITLGGQQVGTAAVDPAIVDTTDEVGQAQVRVTVPEGLEGTVDLVISDDNGTSVTTTVTVVADEEPEEPSSPWEAFARFLWALLKLLFPWWPWP
ncbi:ExeM/NucH family extracellular endonuclease [Occultella gossypii]|uniref:ExeM/NucH family extracellular endonuclease n=1 Tax=Occultella gossypii TaxID=2800820 RepID=A0ABS7SCZ7_9MICO|nr:ExeM/NucH family extracellular endonuclease [Occultella gossypii]MBZ2198231.1 ExeM/NucH family extracellular endonuclease [Occultella gossypii]